MTEQAAEQSAEQTEQPQEGDAAEQQEAKTFDAEYVDKLRKESAKYRTEAKANAAAAKRLAEIEEAQKTAEQKAAERESAAIKRAEEAEARVLRREVALDPTGDGKSAPLSKEDAALLDALVDEDAMRRLAVRLSEKEADRRKNGNHAPREGATTTASGEGAAERQFARSLFAEG